MLKMEQKMQEKEGLWEGPRDRVTRRTASPGMNRVASDSDHRHIKVVPSLHCPAHLVSGSAGGPSRAV